jgi:hypothetical protein
MGAKHTRRLVTRTCWISLYTINNLSLRFCKERISVTDFYPVIARAVSRLPNNNAQTRQELYEHARTIAAAQLRGQEPEKLGAEITRERTALENAIRRVEAESQSKQTRAPRHPTPAEGVAVAPPREESPARTQESPVSPKVATSSMKDAKAMDELEVQMTRGGIILFGPRYTELAGPLIESLIKEGRGGPVLSGSRIDEMTIPDTLMQHCEMYYCHSLAWCEGRLPAQAEFEKWCRALTSGIIFRPEPVPSIGLTADATREPTRDFRMLKGSYRIDLVMSFGLVKSGHCVVAARPTPISPSKKSANRRAKTSCRSSGALTRSGSNT